MKFALYSAICLLLAGCTTVTTTGPPKAKLEKTLMPQQTAPVPEAPVETPIEGPIASDSTGNTLQIWIEKQPDVPSGNVDIDTLTATLNIDQLRKLAVSIALRVGAPDSFVAWANGDRSPESARALWDSGALPNVAARACFAAFATNEVAVRIAARSAALESGLSLENLKGISNET